MFAAWQLFSLPRKSMTDHFPWTHDAKRECLSVLGAQPRAVSLCLLPLPV